MLCCATLCHARFARFLEERDPAEGGRNPNQSGKRTDADYAAIKQAWRAIGTPCDRRGVLVGMLCDRHGA
jgi:hypothetical protein